MKINKMTKQSKVEGIKWNLKLKNHQGILRLDEETIMFAGGVNHAFNRVDNVCFTYNVRTKEIKSLYSMQEIRFCFVLVKLGHFVYAIGGR